MISLPLSPAQAHNNTINQSFNIALDPHKVIKSAPHKVLNKLQPTNVPFSTFRRVWHEENF